MSITDMYQTILSMKRITTPYIFVYGTLKRGSRIGESMTFKRLSRFIAPGTTNGILYSLGSYPGLKHIDSRFIVRGEVFLLKSAHKAIRFLDWYENAYLYQLEYIRAIVPVKTATGHTIMCHTYLYNRSTLPHTKIKGGEYRPARARRFSL